MFLKTSLIENIFKVYKKHAIILLTKTSFSFMNFSFRAVLTQKIVIDKYDKLK